MSELSKPVMYSIACNGVVEEIGGDSQGFSREEVKAELDSWGDVVHGVYSVCALYSQEYVSALTQRIAELEAKLATPVRLPDVRQSSSGDRYQWSDGAHNYRLDVISMLLSAGFTVAVAGDE